MIWKTLLFIRLIQIAEIVLDVGEIILGGIVLYIIFLIEHLSTDIFRERNMFQ